MFIYPFFLTAMKSEIMNSFLINKKGGKNMEMKASEMAYAVCNDCHTFKMGHKSFKAKEGFMKCEGCGMKLHELKW